MHRTFPFHDLSDDEFEELIRAISRHVLGIGVITFAAGIDGGRDAAFNGTAERFPSTKSPLSGKFILQAKHTSNPASSCSDREFGKQLTGEHPKIIALIAGGELEHYFVFTNRKKPAADGIKKEKALIALGLQTAHLLGIEQLREWLTDKPQIWKDLGFDRFELPLRIQTNDITDVITAFHSSVVEGRIVIADGADFTYVPKPRKNRINKLSQAYFEDLLVRSLPYFRPIADFLSNPRNVDFRDQYEDTVDEIRRKLLTAVPPFESFDAALTYIIDHVSIGNPGLARKRRLATVFLHYMYYTCDIGQHADTVEAS
jgi:hypothetical protein